MSVRVWRVDAAAIRERLQAWAEDLGADERVLAVVLFGSLARGDATPMSDADVLVILRESALPFEERLVRYKPSGLGISVEVFLYTVDEARRALAEGFGVVRAALEEGVTLFARGGMPDALPAADAT